MHRDARLPRATRYACVCAETEQGDGRELGMLGIVCAQDTGVSARQKTVVVCGTTFDHRRVSLSSRYGI
jgi:hypothetical protein